ncbi:hypothetical protein SSX86_025877 [Deinandra increscens subsp. villosa]|uniref:Lipoxygenase n=1 Tax=Deinandra increscens subsp. villosa TaxID=3103831 RepID=A0AAP0CH54_9ASTR
MFHKVVNFVLGANYEKKKTKKMAAAVKGKVVLMKKNVLDFNDLGASVLDRAHELLGEHVSIQFISVTHADKESAEKMLRGKVGKASNLKDWISTITPLAVGESTYEVTFDWDEEIGLPGAFLVQNLHHSEFYLMTLTLENVPGHGQVHFVCNSWVYPSKYYTQDRIFFANKAYLPGETPALLRPYRQEEMIILRGNGSGKLEEWDRVYDYALYNDLGDPDNKEKVRPVIGGSSEYPYPRRGRTGRPPTDSDLETESRLSVLESNKIYVPRDERFGHLKKSDFLAYGVESILKFLLPEFESLADDTLDEFDRFEDVIKLYNGGIKLPQGPLLDIILEKIPLQMFKELIRSDGEGLSKYSTPQVIQADPSAWSTDDEFAREMLAGVNPVSIQLLKEFPPTSKLDAKVYGNQNSSIKAHHIEEHLDGLQVNEVVKANRLFILDHHDSLMPYVKRINATSNKIYATRTVLFLQNDGTLKPVAIELSLPHDDEDLKCGAISKVCTPAKDGVEAAIWQLAKTYVAVNDSGVHQLISHWLNTHAVIEPFVIATNRQLSVIHPINKLLHPHFRDTMNINAAARNVLINSKGVLERTFFTGKYSVEISSKIYKDWVFPNHALPKDLILRGMAVEDSNSPHGLRLTIEDYPYAVDGLEIWSAIKTWVTDYCTFYYKNDDMVQTDNELQSWWKEIREEGHGDLKHEPWWPKMTSIQDVIDNCTIIIWISSALHAAVNFGQYPYAGYPLNRPTLSRRLMPEPNTPEYDELTHKPDQVLLKTVSPQFQSLMSITLIEILSRHTSDEIYLGQRECPEWTMDEIPLKAFKKFGNRLKEIEERIVEMNKDERLKNRNGVVKVPYTLLCPSSEEGLTGRGIPNSIDYNKFHKVVNFVLGANYEKKRMKKMAAVKGKVVLMKKNVLDFNDLGASVLDRAHELFGEHISIQFISVTHADKGSTENMLRGKVGRASILKDWITTITPLAVGESTYEVTFDWDEEIGLPGAFLVQNKHHSEFYLMTLTLENVPGHGQVHFVCNSWVYPTKYYTQDRIFFANKAYLPGETPALLRPYRQEEMVILRGNGSGMLKEWDRVYDYALYNDLGDPDDMEKVRPVIGGSSEFPYPRRCRTGRPPNESDLETESRLSVLESLKIYVPRDERFGHLKKSDFLAFGLEHVLKFLLPEFEALADDTLDEFDRFEDVMKLYNGGIKLPQGPLLDRILEKVPLQMLKKLIRSDGEGLSKYPTPQVIQADPSAWSTDDEFAREMLAGVNPVSIQLLKEFPPISKLDAKVYGNQNSSIRAHHIEKHLDGLQVNEVVKANRLFILDHHDSMMPYVKRINATSNKIYATRTILSRGAISKVCTPAKDGVEAAIWQLAKTYVAVNDSGVHELISHWLNTHAVIEPFVIATHRQLSVLHPINKLLHPHFRDTMNINASARNLLINSKGVLERTFFTGKYSIEMSSKIYKDWVFPNHALPMDLVLRGMAVEDSNSPHGLRLTIEDYPYAVDGLEIWSAIKTWVTDYCTFYYKNDDMVQNDNELQSWWKEIRDEGHGDLKHEPWWPKMTSVQDVINNCTIIIWISSALHAAVNFGQYTYGGYPLNRPTLSRRLMPEPNTPEYDELRHNPDQVLLKTVSPQLQSLIGVTLTEILSSHTSDEIYLGQRECPEWTMDEEPLKAFKKFGNRLKEIEERIVEMNKDERLKNRYGVVKVPYTLLCPSSEVGLTGRGIPNSVSI